MKKRIWMGICLLLCAAAGTSLAETAWVQTGKGALNVRSRANPKSDIVYRVPNGSEVEVLDIEGEWSCIQYKGKEGYVKTDFLKDTPPVTPTPAVTPEPVVRKVIQEGGYARIITQGGALNVRKKEDLKSVVMTQVKSGTRVSVIKAMEDWTLITAGGRTGYVQTQYLALDSQMLGKTLYPDDDYLYIREEKNVTSRSLMTVQASQPMMLLEIGDEWVKAACQNEEGKWVEGYICASDISLWRETPGRETAPVRASMQLSAQKLALGDELEVKVAYETGTACSVRILRDGKTVMPEREVTHAAFFYRPRTQGVYQMELLVYKADGTCIGLEARFVVTDHGTAQAVPEVYSQKDGWWLDKKYSRSNLDQSGCAIFALSHALSRLGKGSDRTTPDALAKTYPMYLAESGTVTSNLLAAAGRDFGFKTEKDKVYDANVIAQNLSQGAVCSFAIVSGHIALAVGMSADGTKVIVADSAPSATFERIQNAKMYRQDGQGGYTAIRSLEDFPEAKYYIETDQYGGLSYALDLDYVAGRGVRLIKP